MTEHSRSYLRRVLIDVGAFSAGVAVIYLATDNLPLAVLLGILFAGGTEVAQTRRSD